MNVVHVAALVIVFALSLAAVAFRTSRWLRIVAIVVCFLFNAIFLLGFLWFGQRLALNQGIQPGEVFVPPSAEFSAGVSAAFDVAIPVSIYLFLSSFALVILLLWPKKPGIVPPNPSINTDAAR